MINLDHVLSTGIKMKILYHMFGPRLLINVQALYHSLKIFLVQNFTELLLEI